MSFRGLLGFVLVGLAAAYATPIHSLLVTDVNDSLSMYLDGSLLSGVCFSGPPQCTVGFSLPGFTVSSPLPQNFNIYADAGFTVLTDTLALSSFAAGGGTVGFLLHFHADLDGTPLTPLAGATSILGDGTVQTATTMAYSDGLTADMIQFQSDVPEPRYTALLALGILGCWFVGRTPWSAADARVGLSLSTLAEPDQGVRRGRGRPPHKNTMAF